jgi:hypothetical protein
MADPTLDPFAPREGESDIAPSHEEAARIYCQRLCDQFPALSTSLHSTLKRKLLTRRYFSNGSYWSASVHSALEHVVVDAVGAVPAHRFPFWPRVAEAVQEAVQPELGQVAPLADLSPSAPPSVLVARARRVDESIPAHDQDAVSPEAVSPEEAARIYVGLLVKQFPNLQGALEGSLRFQLAAYDHAASKKTWALSAKRAFDAKVRRAFLVTPPDMPAWPGPNAAVAAAVPTAGTSSGPAQQEESEESQEGQDQEDGLNTVEIVGALEPFALLTQPVANPLADPFDNPPVAFTLAQVLQLTPEQTGHYAEVPVTELGLRLRPANCLARERIQTVGELLATTDKSLLQIRNMGQGSVDQVVESLRDFISRHQGPGGDDPEAPPSCARTLRDEWLTFAGHPVPLPLGFSHAPGQPVVPLEELGLASEAHALLVQAGLFSLEDLLDWTWSQLFECVGEDAGQVLDALVARAHRQRRSKPEPPPTPSRDELVRMLEERWAQLPVAELRLSKSTLATLRVQVLEEPSPTPFTVSAAIRTLKDPRGLLFWNLAAFCDLWNQLVSFGLREGDALEVRRQLMQANEPPYFPDALEACRGVCSTSEWEVLEARFGLAPGAMPRTLQEVSAKRHVSRERVRQLEGAAFRKMRADLGRVISLGRSIQFLTERAGGLWMAEDAGDSFAKYFHVGEVPAANVAAMLLAAFKETQSIPRSMAGNVRGAATARRGAIYGLVTRARLYPVVIKAATRLWADSTQTIRSEEWISQVAQAMLQATRQAAREAESAFMREATREAMREAESAAEEGFVLACLRADGRFDPEQFESARANLNLEEALVETLNHLGAPAHYTHLTDKLNQLGIWKRDTTTRSVHGRLGAYPELFVCIDRGTYGLASWGLEEQRRTRDLSVLIADAAAEFLEERDEPTPEDDIVAYVMARKKCRDFSIRQRLFYDKRFHRFGPKMYGLKKWVA